MGSIGLVRVAHFVCYIVYNFPERNAQMCELHISIFITSQWVVYVSVRGRSRETQQKCVHGMGWSLNCNDFAASNRRFNTCAYNQHRYLYTTMPSVQMMNNERASSRIDRTCISMSFISATISIEKTLPTTQEEWKSGNGNDRKLILIWCCSCRIHCRCHWIDNEPINLSSKLKFSTCG